VAENEQFEYAYRERACMLRLFVPFNVEEDERLLCQLEHLTYMVLGKQLGRLNPSTVAI
jgi:hypothetical protein